MKLRKFGWLLGLTLWIGVSACNRNLVPEQVAPERIEIDDALESARADSPTAVKVARIIAPYQQMLGASMEEIIGRVPRELTKGKPESTLGNWLADLLYTEAVRYADRSIAFAVQNYGGIRVNSLPVGDLPVRKVYELMPFDNVLVLVELDAATLRTFIDHMAASGGWPISRQLRFQITAAGKATDIALNGKPLSSDRNYWVAMPDYVANGGSDCGFLRGRPQVTTDKFVRDLILLHLREAFEQGRAVTTELDGRIRQ